MAKSQFEQEVRDEYKSRERYIKTKAELNFGGQRQGLNLLPAYTKTSRISGMTDADITLYNNNWDCSINGYYATEYSGGIGWATYDMQSFTLPAGTYTLSAIREPSKGNQSSSSLIYIVFRYKKTAEQNNYTYITLHLGMGPTTEKVYISNTITFDFDQTFDNNPIQIHIAPPSENINQIYNENIKLMINEGTEPLPWWEQSSGGEMIDDVLTIGENGICQMLDFRIDEKSDIYYESMPFSEMSIDVDNTLGFFNDFSENSIVDKLNKDSYVDFYLDINDTGWRKAWTMQFDSLKATNEKATIKFKPYCMSIFNSMIYDKDRILNTYVSLDKDRLANLINGNYGVQLTSEAQYGFTFVNDEGISTKVSDLLYRFPGTLPVLEEPQILTISDNKKLAYRRISYPYIINDTINDNVILEKPLITKETLQGYILNCQHIIGVISSQNELKKTITSTFRNSNETLLIYCDDLEADDITQNDITLTNANFEWLGTTTRGSTYTYGKRYILLEISGNIGDVYTININANNLRKVDMRDLQKIYSKEQYDNIDNFMKITGFDVNGVPYWQQLMNNMEKKIKLKISALPYLQVGDYINVKDEDKYVITEIHTTWSNGFIMEIIAYKVNYSTSSI